MNRGTLTGIALLGLCGLLSLSSCTAPAVTAEPPIPAQNTCAEFGDVLTIVNNSRIAKADGRMADQEYQGWLRVAARVLARVSVEPSTELAQAVGAAQVVAPAVAIGRVSSADFADTSDWLAAVDAVAKACEDAGTGLSSEGFTGG